MTWHTITGWATSEWAQGRKNMEKRNQSIYLSISQSISFIYKAKPNWWTLIDKNTFTLKFYIVVNKILRRKQSNKTGSLSTSAFGRWKRNESGLKVKKKTVLKSSTSLKVPGWRGEGWFSGRSFRPKNNPYCYLQPDRLFRVKPFLSTVPVTQPDIVIVVCGDSGYSCCVAERSRTSRWSSGRQTHSLPFLLAAVY